MSKMSKSRKRFIKKSLFQLEETLEKIKKGIPVDRDKKFYVPSQKELCEAFDIDYDPNGKRDTPPDWAMKSEKAYKKWVNSLTS